MPKGWFIFVLLIIVAIASFTLYATSNRTGSAGNSVPVARDTAPTTNNGSDTLPATAPAADTTRSLNAPATAMAEGKVFMAEEITLPLLGSAPTENVQHTIPIEEIRQGCFRQDCIPSIEEPEFITVAAAAKLLPPESIGIALSYKGVERFYPFPMLETHELVNDTVAGDPLLISYCPLCGTGIVFNRTLDGQPVEFGVSGMLWQSNLLMYNRAENLANRNLWSQVLGQAVVGGRAGERLAVIPSDIMRFAVWQKVNPDGEVLNGEPANPYDGRYYEVARSFAPNYTEQDSALPADSYVYGIEVEGVYKAYPRDLLSAGTTTDLVGGTSLYIINDMQTGSVQFKASTGEIISDVEGFWFSWKAAHPDTLVWDNT